MTGRKMDSTVFVVWLICCFVILVFAALLTLKAQDRYRRDDAVRDLKVIDERLEAVEKFTPASQPSDIDVRQQRPPTLDQAKK